MPDPTLTPFDHVTPDEPSPNTGGWTEGPWELEYDSEDGAHIIRMGDAITSRSFHDVENLIRYEHGLYPDEDSEQGREQFRRAEAIAHLAAAAPDLYEALREAKGLADMAVMSDDLDGTPSEDQAALENLRGKIDAALAKAKALPQVSK